MKRLADSEMHRAMYREYGYHGYIGRYRQFFNGQEPTADEIWWMNCIGYLSRGEEFQDRNIGRCMGANPHGRPSRV